MILKQEALERVSPEETGIASSAVLRLVEELEKTGNELHGLMVARHGKVIAETWWAPYSASLPHACHSLGKSYTCTAVGIACTEGKLHPDDLMADLFAEEIEACGAKPDANFQKLRLRDVMSMTNGMAKMPALDDHWMENYFREPVVNEPGTCFYYNTVGSCMLGALIEKISGQSLRAYLDERLFSHIGIRKKDLIWLKFQNGICAEPGVCATTEANLRLGLFYLADGFADGRQIVSRAWMEEAKRVQIHTDQTGNPPEGRCGYGWQLWRCSVPGAYRFDGGQGQLSIIAPNEDMVVAIHQGGRDPDGCETVQRAVMTFLRGVSDGSSLARGQKPCEKVLRACLQSRRIAPWNMPPCYSRAKLAPFAGTWRIAEGDPNLWIEVIPFDEDFWHLFYAPGVDAATRKIELIPTDVGFYLKVNDLACFDVSMDGRMRLCESESVLPELKTTVAQARFEADGALFIRLRWLNGWFESQLRLERVGERLRLINIKPMLHEQLPPIRYEAWAEKMEG